MLSRCVTAGRVNAQVSCHSHSFAPSTANCRGRARRLKVEAGSVGGALRLNTRHDAHLTFALATSRSKGHLSESCRRNRLGRSATHSFVGLKR
jgi:hypothetical protein